MKLKCVLICVILAILGSLPVRGDYTSGALHMRESGNKEAKIMNVIPYGTEIPVLNDNGSWVRTMYNHQIGYVRSEYVQSEKPPERTYLGNYLITAYEDTGCACANGNYPSVGYTVAHNTLPFGTKIYIEDVGERVVEDRGPSRFGSEWCDIYLGDSGECNAWGMQYKDVYLIEE